MTGLVLRQETSLQALPTVIGTMDCSASPHAGDGVLGDTGLCSALTTVAVLAQNGLQETRHGSLLELTDWRCQVEPAAASVHSIFRLYASENGLVTSSSLPRPAGPKSKGKRQLS